MLVQRRVKSVDVYTLSLNHKERIVPLRTCYPSTIDVGPCLTFLTIGHELKVFQSLLYSYQVYLLARVWQSCFKLAGNGVLNQCA